MHLYVEARAQSPVSGAVYHLSLGLVAHQLTYTGWLASTRDAELGLEEPAITPGFFVSYMEIELRFSHLQGKFKASSLPAGLSPQAFFEMCNFASNNVLLSLFKS